MTLLAASRIKPSEEINSVYTTSAPFSLHKALKGGSETSSMGASNKGKSGNSILPIVTILYSSIFLVEMNDLSTKFICVANI